MKGPKPKAAATRQRRNKAPSAATLEPESATAKAKVPDMPEKPGGWTEQAKEFWKRFWRSPMAARCLKADAFRLEILTDMVDRYWRGDTALAAQIRLEGDSFATSPLARRRLEWEIRDHAEPAELPAAGGERPVAKPGADVRNVLTGDFK